MQSELQTDAGCHASINTALYDSTEWAFGFRLELPQFQQLAEARLEVDFDMDHSGPTIEDQ